MYTKLFTPLETPVQVQECSMSELDMTRCNTSSAYNFEPVSTRTKQPHSSSFPISENSSLSDMNSLPSTKKPSRPHSDRNQNQRVNSWTHVEEVFLVGAIMSRWFVRGSLAPSRDKGINSPPEDCWESIKIGYETSWDDHCLKTGELRPIERSSTALMRHFKIMKTDDGKSLRKLYLEWEVKYNTSSFELAINGCREETNQENQFPIIPAVDEKSLSRGSSSEVLDLSTTTASTVEIAPVYRERAGSKRRKPSNFFGETPLMKQPQEFGSRYYNTVQGSDAEKMARQLQMERHNFGRSLRIGSFHQNQEEIGAHLKEDSLELLLSELDQTHLPEENVGANYQLNGTVSTQDVFMMDHNTMPAIHNSHLPHGHRRKNENNLFNLFGIDRNDQQ